MVSLRKAAQGAKATRAQLRQVAKTAADTTAAFRTLRDAVATKLQVRHL
jgi:hypothetical protein